LGCAVGALFIGIIVVVICLMKQKKKAEEREVIYGAMNGSGSVRGDSQTPLVD
jgi:hypothetical protein